MALEVLIHSCRFLCCWPQLGPSGPGLNPTLFCSFLVCFVVASRGVALLSPLCSSQCSSMMLCYMPSFLFAIPHFPGHCFTEPIHYPALPKGAWLATGSLSPSILQIVVISCSQPPPSSFNFRTLCSWHFPSVQVYMVSNSGCSCIVSHVLLKRLPSHPLPNILVEVWGFEAVTMLTHCRRMPSAFVQLENLSSVFLLCLLATATGHVEGSPQNLPACPFVHPSSSARPFCVFFLLPRYNWQDRPLRNLQLGVDVLSSSPRF